MTTPWETRGMNPSATIPSALIVALTQSASSAPSMFETKIGRGSASPELPWRMPAKGGAVVIRQSPPSYELHYSRRVEQKYRCPRSTEALS